MYHLQEKKQDPTCHLNNTPLEAVTDAKYLGVTITSDLKWTSTFGSRLLCGHELQ